MNFSSCDQEQQKNIEKWLKDGNSNAEVVAEMAGGASACKGGPPVAHGSYQAQKTKRKKPRIPN